MGGGSGRKVYAEIRRVDSYRRTVEKGTEGGGGGVKDGARAHNFPGAHLSSSQVWIKVNYFTVSKFSFRIG